MEQANDVDDVAKKRSIGLRLRQERKSRGWSQATLAEQMKTSVMNINRWENGKVLPQPHHRERLGTLFKKNIEDLFEDEVTLVADDPQASPSFPLLENHFAGDQNRQRLLEKVYVIWIKGLLDQSLQEVAYIMPGLYERSEAVTSPWKRSLQDLHQPDYSLPSDVSIDKVYADAGQELLILGEPGSGKTMLLLELARILLERTRYDETQPMPVILNLSSWAIRRQPIARWLIEELNIKYQIPRVLGQLWVEHGQILPLLDGLDEVAPQHHNLCIDAINSYRQGYGLVPLVVCSRNTAYDNLTNYLHLQNAVVIQPLSPQQIDEHLVRGGKALEPVHKVLHDDAELHTMVTTPLMLKILILTYRDKVDTNLQADSSLEARRQRIFEAYVQHMLQRRGHTRYTPQTTTHGLHWLAHQLDKHGQNDFSIEQIQMDWLPKIPLLKLYPAIAVGLVYGLFFGLIQGGSALLLLCSVLLFMLLNGCIFGVQAERSVLEGEKPSGVSRRRAVLSVLGSWPVYGLLNGLLIGFLVGPAAGIYNGFFIGLVYAGFGKLDPSIQTVAVPPWSWVQLRASIMRSILVGAGYGLLTGIYWQLKNQPHMLSLSSFLPCLFFGLCMGLLTGLLTVLVHALSHTKPVAECSKSKHGIRNGVLLAIISTLSGGLLLGTTYSIVLYRSFNAFSIPYKAYENFFPQSGVIPGLTYGLLVGIFLWLRSGGMAYIQHLLVRIILWRAGSVPWNYPDFLDEATERILLRKVDGRYTFAHQLLREYFALKQF